MPMLTQIVAALAGAVILVEFWLVFQTRRDRKIWENLNNRKEQ